MWMARKQKGSELLTVRPVARRETSDWANSMYFLQEQIRHQLLIRVHCIFAEIGNAFFDQHFFIGEEIAGAFDKKVV